MVGTTIWANLSEDAFASVGSIVTPLETASKALSPACKGSLDGKCLAESKLKMVDW